jgi:hypothetical protein
MRIERLDNMIKGWFVGDFSPTIYNSREVEVAIKRYSAGSNEGRHVHRVATEITVIVSGEVIMNGQVLKEGDIAVLAPGEAADFSALTDTVTTVVKLPCVPGDKFEEV